ncbi:CirA Outer membrane receptor proteins, mostly Fe transport [Oxalobacteraceae bacterium]
MRKPIVCAIVASSIASTAFAAEENTTLAPVTVTGTREQTLLSETPSAVGIISRKAIEQNRPSHPQQLLGQIPGVAIGVTNGEGHTTAIRHGFTTSPLYLFLEDGIPIRATGNFNHNALYELNIPSAGGVEVVRGIGSALYGSDAIGGTINVLTRTPREKAGADLSIEGGSFGWARLLGGIDSGRIGRSALRADFNITHTDGWRQRTAYDRQSANLRWDYEWDEATLIKTIFGATHIDQQTGANSPLPESMYLNSPTTNLRSPAYRIVDALRLSSAIERDIGQGQTVTVTPYFRDNRMQLNGTFNFSCSGATCTGRIEDTSVQSFGLMLRYRKNIDDAARTRVISGLDLDYSPSRRAEDRITLSSTGTGAARNFTGYDIVGRSYEYKVLYQSVAPYAHIETSPAENLRITTGLRYDYARFELDNLLSESTHPTGKFFQLPDSVRSFARLSPKLGATLQLNPSSHLFASYNQGFRTPSENQLFRSGVLLTATNAAVSANSALNLRPILAEQYELGLRGDLSGFNFELVGYLLNKNNDLLRYTPSLGPDVQTNNGTTRHQGVEFGLGRAINSMWRIDAAAVYAKHQYLDWAVNATTNYSNKEIEASPRLLSNVRLTWVPVQGTFAQLEWVRVGSYFLAPSNTEGKYTGHDLFNLRVSQQLDDRWTLFGRVLNLADVRYADSAQVSSSVPVYSPGLPRAVYVGLEGKW